MLYHKSLESACGFFWVLPKIISSLYHMENISFRISNSANVVDGGNTKQTGNDMHGSERREQHVERLIQSDTRLLDSAIRRFPKPGENGE
jgi:hypothetical protein